MFVHRLLLKSRFCFDRPSHVVITKYFINAFNTTSKSFGISINSNLETYFNKSHNRKFANLKKLHVISKLSKIELAEGAWNIYFILTFWSLWFVVLNLRYFTHSNHNQCILCTDWINDINFHHVWFSLCRCCINISNHRVIRKKTYHGCGISRFCIIHIPFIYLLYKVGLISFLFFLFFSPFFLSVHPPPPKLKIWGGGNHLPFVKYSVSQNKGPQIDHFFFPEQTM